jgi:murein L,D-transpeptidase YafK
MAFLRVLLILVTALGLSACSSKFKTYNGPEVTQVVVQKQERKMFLMHNDKVLKSYKIGLGFAPEGHKHFEGDGKTPEGTYFISHRNPKSEFHLSLGISYPNNADRAYAAANGKRTGGDIFIHGGPKKRVTKRDWTAGCIAVTDKQIEQIYSMVKPGTPIHIMP